jgi:hypothetical protein
MHDTAERQHAHELVAADDRIERMARSPCGHRHERGDGLIRLSDDGIRQHHVAHAQSRQRVVRNSVAPLCSGRVEEEPADDGQPSAGEGAVEDEKQDAAGDHQQAEPATDVAGDCSRPLEVPLYSPENRAQHAAAVERQRGNEVEDEQQQVDVADPGEDAVQRL